MNSHFNIVRLLDSSPSISRLPKFVDGRSFVPFAVRSHSPWVPGEERLQIYLGTGRDSDPFYVIGIGVHELSLVKTKPSKNKKTELEKEILLKKQIAEDEFMGYFFR